MNNLFDPLSPQTRAEINAKIHDELLVLWKEKIFELKFLFDFITLVKMNNSFFPVIDKIKIIKGNTGLSEESVWANYLIKLMKEAGKYNKHDERVLSQYKYNDEEQQKFDQAFFMLNIIGQMPLIGTWL